MSIERKLDQFYTNKDIAFKCYTLLNEELIKHNIEKTIWLEPSSGNGSFFSILEGEKLGIDIAPKINGVIKHDFLDFHLEYDDYITIGNPPFGKNSSLAIKFFNKCALNSKVIAFIVPKTFRKDSVVKKLNTKMHLVYEWEIPEKSFNLKEEIVSVPCVFQIWIRKNLDRTIIKENIIIDDFEFGDRINSDFAFQRVGVKAGTLKNKDLFNTIADPSHLFIRVFNDVAVKILNLIDWSKIKFNTAGNPSISKKELIKEYSKYRINLLYELEKSIIVRLDNELYLLSNTDDIYSKIKLKKEIIIFNDNLNEIRIIDNQLYLNKKDYIEIKKIILNN